MLESKGTMSTETSPVQQRHTHADEESSLLNGTSKESSPYNPKPVHENNSPCIAQGEATILNEIFNLFKNLVGAGVLGLPRGIADFAGYPGFLVIVASTVIIFIMGAIFGYYFLLMGRICRATGASSYREAWELSVGSSGGWVIALNTTLMAGLGNLAYSMILADTTKSLLMSSGIDVTRTQSLIGVTIIVLLPLCLVKKLTVLAPFSFVGMAGILFTVVAMAIRYYDGTYSAAGESSSGGKYVSDLEEHLRPSFSSTASDIWDIFSIKVLLLVCMTFQAYFAHYNAPRYYNELKDNTVPRFSIVVGTSFSLSAVTYGFMSYYGFATFGKNSDGFILNNYSTNDGLASICRFAIAVALAFTYPLPFIGVRDGILDLLQVPNRKKTPFTLNALTLILLVLFTVLAMHFENLAMVNAVGGGTLGTAVVFVFPALMYRSVVRHLGPEASTLRQRREAKFAIGLMWVGIAMGSTGVIVALFPNLI